jgi:hypothetical protein
VRNKIALSKVNNLAATTQFQTPAPFPPEQVLGLLNRRDFASARQRAPGFSRWGNHRDFVTERDALFVGYGECGVGARFQRVSFDAFERFGRLTGAPVDIDGLDEFAAHWRFRARHPDAPVIGRFGLPGDPERNIIAGANMQRVYIRPEVYVRWRDDFARNGLLKAPGLNAYAAYVVEFCLVSDFRSR